MSMNKLTNPRVRKCISCNQPYPIRIYDTAYKCSKCVKWEIIRDDMRRVSGSGSADYAEWDAAI